MHPPAHIFIKEGSDLFLHFRSLYLSLESCHKEEFCLQNQFVETAALAHYSASSRAGKQNETIRFQSKPFYCLGRFFSLLCATVRKRFSAETNKVVTLLYRTWMAVYVECGDICYADEQIECRNMSRLFFWLEAKYVSSESRPAELHPSSSQTSAIMQHIAAVLHL